MRAMFEFLDKMGVDYWCFHDRSAHVPIWAFAVSSWSVTSTNLLPQMRCCELLSHDCLTFNWAVTV